MKAIWVTACTILMAAIVGCGGGNPVDEIIKEQRAIIEMQKAGKIDTARIEAVEKKVANLTTAQKEEYAKRMMKEMQNLLPKVPDVKIPGGVEVPKLP